MGEKKQQGKRRGVGEPEKRNRDEKEREEIRLLQRSHFKGDEEAERDSLMNPPTTCKRRRLKRNKRGES